MKKFNLFVATMVLSSIIIFSCSKSENNSVVNDERVAVRYSTVEKSPLTRISEDGSEWDGGENIGIFMVNHQLNTLVENAGNIKYYSTNPGSYTMFEPDNTSIKIYYPVSGAKVDFFAYHSYVNGIVYNETDDDYIFPVDVASAKQADQDKIDLMSTGRVDKGGAGYDKSMGNSIIEINFTHRMSKLVMTVEKGAGVTSLDGLQVVIKGMNTKVPFKLIEEKFGTADTPLDIVPRTVTENAKYEATLIPAATLDDDCVVLFTTGGNTYTWKMNKDITEGLAGGNKYTYNITLTKTGLVVKGTITPWVNKGGTGIAD